MHLNVPQCEDYDDGKYKVTHVQIHWTKNAK